MLDDDLPQFDENELSAEDLAILQAFDAKQSWQIEPATSAPIVRSSVEDAPNNLLPFFAIEATEDVASIRNTLNQLEIGEHIEPSHFLTLRRLAHKIHGTAGAVECDNMATVAHYIEIISMQTSKGQIFPVIGVGALAQSVAVLEIALQNIVTQNSEGDVPLAKLQDFFKDLNINLEQPTIDEEEATADPLSLPAARITYTSVADEQSGVPLIRVDARRIERLLQYGDHVSELRVGVESAQEQVESVVHELRAAQTALRQIQPLLTSLLEEPQVERVADDLTFSSLVARILSQGGQTNTRGETGRRSGKGRARSSLIKDPGALCWDELDLERFDEKDQLLRSLSEAVSNMLLSSSRIDTALTSLNLRQQEYNMQVGNMRSAALLLRLAPLKLLVPYLRQIVEVSSQMWNVQFEVLGEETEADQEVIDVLAEPLGQLLQTCLSGIRLEAQSCQAWFHARGVGNEITLEIGFSMPVSGGALEIIREPVQRLHGTYILLRNGTGGLSFCLRFPRSQGAAQCLLVRAGSQYLLVPFSQVQSIEERRSDTLDRCYHLCDLLGFPSSPQSSVRAHPMLILPQETASHKVTGIVVDEVVNEVEYIVRPLVPYLQRPGVAGAASDGRGRVLLMLDLTELVRYYAVIQRSTANSAMSGAANLPIRVLVADDSSSLRLALAQSLQQAHFSVEEARDGMDALEKVLASPPDIFLLDVEMPNLNGYELLGMMSQYPELIGVKTIMLSSRSSDKHIQHARALGAHAYLTKPCSHHELLETIYTLLKR